MENQDKLQLQGIYSEGYGTIAKSIMKDKELSITAKGIYAYLCSFCGGGTTCFPSREKICDDLNINKDTFTKHIRQLVDKNYITINKMRSDKNKVFCHNIYTINLINIKQISVSEEEKAMSENFGRPETPCPKEPDTENSDINNNNLNNKEKEEEKIRQENLKKLRDKNLANVISAYENNITLITEFVREDIIKYLDDNHLEADLIIAAIKEATSRNVRKWNYVCTILNDCVDKKITTKHQYKISQEEFKSNRNKPKNEKIDTEEKVEYRESTLTEEEYFKRMKGTKHV